MIECNGKVNLEAIEGIETRPFITVFDHHRSLDTDKALGGILFLNPGRLDQKNEGAGATVHDGHFGRAHIDIGIIDAQTGKCRQQMLDRGNPGLSLDQRGR